MKVLDYLLVRPFASVFVGALTDQQYSDSCDADMGGHSKVTFPLSKISWYRDKELMLDVTQ